MGFSFTLVEPEIHAEARASASADQIRAAIQIEEAKPASEEQRENLANLRELLRNLTG